MSEAASFADVNDAIRREERDGTRVAMLGRLAVLVVLAVWMGTTRQAPTIYNMFALIGLFAASSIAQYWLAARGLDSMKLRMLFVVGEVLVIIAAIFAAFIVEFGYLPDPVPFRFAYHDYFFPIIATVAFSYSRRLVLLAGACFAVGWSIIAIWVELRGPWIGWSDVQRYGDAEAFLSVYLSPNFHGIGSRVQEIMAIVATAGLLALVVHRSRRLLQRQIESERQRHAVRTAFGHYVPDDVADLLSENPDGIAPENRRATVLFADIAGFTPLTETLGPQGIMDLLNRYFEVVARTIGRHGGVITQFQGDAVLAVFNAPRDLSNYEAAAVAASHEILSELANDPALANDVKVRIGIATGELIAGTVGGGGRLSYTVHGDAVNRAARLEALNKETGTTILVDDATQVAILDHNKPFTDMGEVTPRGQSHAVRVFGLTDSGVA